MPGLNLLQRSFGGNKEVTCLLTMNTPLLSQGHRVAQGRRFEESEGAEAQRIAQASRLGGTAACGASGTACLTRADMTCAEAMQTWRRQAGRGRQAGGTTCKPRLRTAGECNREIEDTDMSSVALLGC